MHERTKVCYDMCKYASFPLSLSLILSVPIFRSVCVLDSGTVSIRPVRNQPNANVVRAPLTSLLSLSHSLSLSLYLSLSLLIIKSCSVQNSANHKTATTRVDQQVLPDLNNAIYTYLLSGTFVPFILHSFSRATHGAALEQRSD